MRYITTRNPFPFLISMLLFALFLVGCTSQPSQVNKEVDDGIKLTSDEEKPYIGFVLDTLQDERWYRDKELFEEKVKELGGNVKTLAANGSDQIQISLVELLIEEGVDILVIVPTNAETTSEIVKMAHEKDVKVISYDRLIRNADVDHYISFDNEKVGELQATGIIEEISEGNFAYIGGAETDNNAILLRQGSMNILQPLIDEGKINLVFDRYTEDWNPIIAKENMQDVLRNGEKVDAVIAANDGTAGGAIEALSDQGLAGSVPISGQDAELSAIKRIVDGTQSMTVYKPIHLLAEQAAEIAIKYANGESISTETNIDNGKINVPATLLEPIIVTKDNIDETIIKDGYLTSEEIYGQ
ncbi:simple sugar transport system substrate-binding protein/D-xylose transport system substrate-binding protein [Gracilibacillus halotolerans]|uniref:Simple sugar transport system substrate-binding protein/D-xylose transport system substrate-binding protein n=1 Tax=Gracilibacillus halotolerans TaxID=74386 RepID=A0A841RP41_9BACI|nr:substrate-binding domain-containing protein [Gracilibacillus halotolerans]MBB6512704.1 simple sugar transport system substrate-binding protein/D-xylose transport system substrate-binding protein [Gracilibacillus halotolerans]